MNRNLSVGVGHLPAIHKLDYTSVKRLTESRTLLLTVGSPFFSRGSHFSTVYVKSHSHNTDFTKWSVTLNANLRFHDGTTISARDWYESIARVIRVGTGVHFNPKRDLVGGMSSDSGYCEGLKLDENTVHFTLVAPNANFLDLLGKIESGIVPASHASSADPIRHDKIPSAGPYAILEHTDTQITLGKNEHYPSHPKRSPSSGATLRVTSPQEAGKLFEKGELDLYYPYEPLANDTHAHIVKSAVAHYDFGQTYFLSFRPESRLWTKAARQSLAAQLAGSPAPNKLSIANTLLTGEGLGRVNPPRFEDSEQLPLLTLAAVNDPINRFFVEQISKSGRSVDVIWVSSFAQLFSQTALQADAFIAWNDFHDRSPYTSLYNALNPDRPLIHDPRDYRVRLDQAQQMSTTEEQDHAYKALHRKILESAVVIPLATSSAHWYSRKGVNVDNMINAAFWTITHMD